MLLSAFDALLDGQGPSHGGSLKAIHDKLTHDRARTRSRIVGEGVSDEERTYHTGEMFYEP